MFAIKVFVNGSWRLLPETYDSCDVAIATASAVSFGGILIAEIVEVA